MHPSLRNVPALLCGIALLAACDAERTPTVPTGAHAPSAAPRASMVPAGLVAFYAFDQPNSDWLGAQHVPNGGYEGGGYWFDGQNGRGLDLPVNVNPSAMPEVTIGAWVRVDELHEYEVPAQVLSHDDGGFDRGISVDFRGMDSAAREDERIRRWSAFTGRGVASGISVQIGEWVFLAATYSAGEVSLYMNDHRITAPASPGSGFEFLRVGANPGGFNGGEPFHGTIDNVFVFSRALSATELETIRVLGGCAFTGNCLNTAPTVRVGGPYFGVEGSPVGLSIFGSDREGDPLTHAWSMGDGTTGTLMPRTSYVYSDNGSYPIRYTVTDAYGAQTTATTTATIANVRPVVAPIISGYLYEGEPYRVSGTFADPGADTWTATVDFGDNAGPRPLALVGKTFTFERVLPGQYWPYEVTVAVRDDDDPVAGTESAVVGVFTLSHGVAALHDRVKALSADRPIPGANISEVLAFLRTAHRALVTSASSVTASTALHHAIDRLKNSSSGEMVRVRIDLARIKRQVDANLNAGCNRPSCVPRPNSAVPRRG